VLKAGKVCVKMSNLVKKLAGKARKIPANKKIRG
jgi:hypothetical protein